MKTNKCISCGEEFSEKNVFTPAGWREIYISGMCEKCFDKACSDDNDDQGDPDAYFDFNESEWEENKNMK